MRVQDSLGFTCTVSFSLTPYTVSPLSKVSSEPCCVSANHPDPAQDTFVPKESASSTSCSERHPVDPECHSLTGLCCSELVHSALMGIGVSSVGFMKELWWTLLFRPSISFSEDQESDETQLFFF